MTSTSDRPIKKPITLQPFPYQGSKRALAPFIFQYISPTYSRIIEPFAGSSAIVVYAAHQRIGKKFWINDNYKPLVELWEKIINEPVELADKYEQLWLAQIGSPTEYYMKTRAEFNTDPQPEKLLFLLTRCAKNAVRFNSKGEFNQSPDKRRLGRKPQMMRSQLTSTSLLLKNKTTVSSLDFEEVLKNAKTTDLIYMDPPYQGTSDGKDTRYSSGLSRDRLILALESLTKRKIPFILSYDGYLGDKSYGEPLPESLGLSHIHLQAGRSAQATLNGRAEHTTESLYISPDVIANFPASS